ncbi:glycosyltransferase family 2 protein [Boseongicola aestuarii]|uniref:Beta-monoglucosyldiacylglycerol synthase n=1 Tax=Boseongicola aestuarii TaxID=1470561 RepID=A0A238J3E9_9RHOB|nr:glycosyltransferase family 2 protein [Boseongicola aestuarii]SMX24863.1 Beta-monoglucosyldiacylglycerol synthase [Boseongicola aestuarii]
MPVTFRSLRKQAVEEPKLDSKPSKDGPLRLESIQADARFLDDITPEFAIRNEILPLRRMGVVTLVAAVDYERFQTTRATLESRLGPVAHLPASRDVIRAAITAAAGPTLAHKALRHTSLRESCRAWSGPRSAGRLGGLAILLLVMGYLNTSFLIWTVTIWATLTLVAVTGLRTAGAIAQLRASRTLGETWHSARPVALARHTYPSISVLVPLFNEHDIAPRLVARLSRLEYPQDKLEVLLILEHSDSVTANALAQSELPDWMRIITVPPGSPQTKPRALNYALDFANGEIIGIYDAEDAPAPDQLRTVADTFAKAPPNVACLQGVLDFYNAHNTWLTRCFAIDYATWFRLVLPGLVRLGFAIPLGGTTVFFRRRILEKIGRWDAHNVTEDADLGLRLARRGYRTEFISSVTFEEAIATVPAWIRQRSRWIKGYAVSWAVHMRAPKRLLNELGLRKFLGFQILFLGTLSQFVLAPYLWSFWLVLVGLPHPLGQIAPWGVVVAFAVAFLLCEIATIIALALSVATPRHRDLIWWVPLMHLYFPLSAFACWKAIAELTTRPFYWDKTAHGGPTSRPKRRWRRRQLQHHV